MRDDQPGSQRVASRLATTADVMRYFGERPKQTLRAIIITLNDEPAAIVGLANEGRCAKLFSEYVPSMRGRLRCMTVLRALKTVMAWVAECRRPVVAITQPDEPDSPRLLERLGFVFHNSSEHGEVYEWLG